MPNYNSFSGLTVTKNKVLTLINIVSLDRLEVALNVTDNPELTRIELDGGTDGLTGATFFIENNARLETINMENLTKIDIKGNFIMKRNAMLKTIQTQSLETFTALSLIVVRNNALDKVEMPKLTSLVGTCTFLLLQSVMDFIVVIISHNNQLTNINFNSGDFSTQRLVISQNKKLTNVAIGMAKAKISVKISVRGNPVLAVAYLTLLGQVNMAEKDIQQFGGSFFEPS